jgi:NAD(P)-dependent dehydrogenase (short-subunit alcohol dehydrogenase family)
MVHAMNRRQKLLLGAATALTVRAIQRRFQARHRFTGQSVVITGGSRGLGLILAREMAAEGARLTLLGRDRDSLAAAADELAANYPVDVLALPGDISDREFVVNVIERVIDEYGRIDVLINNAGIIQIGPYEHMGLHDFEEAMGVHFWGPLYAMMASIRHMRRQGEGRIVNISSIGGVVAVPHLLPYVASKFALTGLSDGLRAELARERIHVTTVVPGLMRTGSHVNALIKGQHEPEFAWFSILGAIPASSTHALAAARQIMDACRRGDPHLTITPQARLLAIANTLFPGAVAQGMALFEKWLMPGPAGTEGNEIRAGWESSSEWAPSALTWPADRHIEKNNQLDEEAIREYHNVEK